LASDNELRHAHLFWIEKAHKALKGKAISVHEQEELLNKLMQIKPTSLGLYNQLLESFAKPLGIKSSPMVEKYSDYQGDLLNYIHQCKQSD